MGKVIFNSDDFGYSHGVNYGIVDAYQRGILTSTTLMANMPGFEHAVKLKKELPDLGVGVHLTLTCGKPLLENVDSLVEGDQFKQLSFYTKPFEIDNDQLYQEWNAQIQKVYRAGIIPTHLDSHHHTHTFDIIRKLSLHWLKNMICQFAGTSRENQRFDTSIILNHILMMLAKQLRIKGKLIVQSNNI